MFDDLGLPIINSSPALGTNQSYPNDQATPVIVKSDSLWSEIKSEASSAVDSVEVGIGSVLNDAEDGFGTMKNTGVAIYQGGINAVKTVVGDATDVVAAPIEKLGLYVIIGLVVIGGVIYFAGKSGAIRVNALV